MKSLNKKMKLLLLAPLALLFMTACEDDMPNDYQPEYFIEAYLLVDQPIQGIKVMETQPVDKALDWDNAYVTNADVKIILEDNDNTVTYALEFSNEEPKGYYFPDTTVKVLPMKSYKLEINFADGKYAYAYTNSPDRIDWVDEPKDYFYYPQDTLSLKRVDSLDISWTDSETNDFYLVSVKNLDTLEYGIYLDPQEPNNKNRRTYNVFMNDYDEQYWETTTWNLIANTKTASVWMAFKWFGKQQIKVWACDDNMLEWFMQSMDFMGSGQFDENQSSIKGDGFGVFGSSSVAEKTSFMYKNQI